MSFSSSIARHRATVSVAISLGALCVTAPAVAQQAVDVPRPAASAADEDPDGLIVVTGKRATRSAVTLEASEIQKVLPGVNPVKAIQTLPGVQFETADPWGNNEQNISLVVHGFNQNQLGFTLDGVPLGDQSYGNFNSLSPQRAVISENVGSVRLTAGAADLGTASASNLGGGLETYTSDPAATYGVRFGQTLGSYDANRTYLRLDSGTVDGLGGTNAGYISVVRQRARAWEFDARQGGWQANAKFVHKDANGTLTGYFALSDKVEPNQDSVAHNAGGLEPYYRTVLFPDWPAALRYVDANGAPPANNPNNYTNYYGDAQRTDYLTYLKYERRFGDSVTFTNQVYGHHDEGQGQITGPIAAAGLPGLFRIYYPGQNLKQVFGNSGYALRTTEYGIDRRGLLSTLAARVGTHELEIGGWYEHNRNTIFRRWYAAPIDSPPSPYEWADPAQRRLTQYASVVKYDLVQLHVQDRWHVTPALAVEAGFKSSLQFADGRVPVQPLPGALPGSSTGFPQGRLNTKKWFLPAIGAVWDVTPDDQLFAHVQKNVRQFQASVAAGLSPYNVGSQQAFDQIKANTQPESSWTYEAGLRTRHALSLGPITAIEGQVSAYHVAFSNRLLQISATPVIASVIGGVSILQNVGGVTAVGITSQQRGRCHLCVAARPVESGRWPVFEKVTSCAPGCETGVTERGNYQGSGLALVDDKGRVAIPNALRSTLAENAPRADGKDGGTVIVAAHEDQPCLVAYDPAYIAELKRELNERVALSRGIDGKIDHNIKRGGANGEAVPFDGSGRFIMPGFPRFYANIGAHAFFWGTLDYIEIWDPRTLLSTPGIAPQMVAACRYYCQEKGIALD